MYIEKLCESVDDYNNTIHRIIRMRPVDVKCKTYINFNNHNNTKKKKLNVGDHLRLSKYQNIFAKGYKRNWTKVFVIKKVKGTSP